MTSNSRVQQIFGNPLEWTSASKALVLHGITALVHLQYLAAMLYVLTRADREQLIHVDHVHAQLPFSVTITLISILMIPTVVLAGRLLRDSLAFEVVAVHYYAATLIYFGYLSGLLSIATGAVLAGAPLLGFILYNRWVVLSALVMALAAHIVLSILTALGEIPYAPALIMTPDGENTYSLFWTLGMYAFTLPHLVVLTALAWYVLGRWRRREQEVYTLSITDPLTGLPNRRSILAHLQREHQRSSQGGPPLSVVMVDLDCFKEINDDLGHAAGDAVLRSSAQFLRSCLRQVDEVGRFGGEEFLIVLPGTDLDGARVIAERCRRGLEQTSIVVGQGRQLSITASLGLHCNREDRSLDPERMIQMADRALYEAKETGRNRVCLAS